MPGSTHVGLFPHVRWFMSKQIIRIPKDVREAHKQLLAVDDTVPKELPADIETKMTSVSVSDLDGDSYQVAHFKYGWPGFRVEIHVRMHADGRRSIEHIKVRNAKQSQSRNYDSAVLYQRKVMSWKF